MYKWLLIILVAFCVVSCDDDIATSSDVQPVASADTLHLGTVLAGNSSQTYQLKLYNRHSSDLKLTSVKLRNAGSSGFRMNVDGMNGSSFTDSDLLRIAARDSLFIFVEATFKKSENIEQHHVDYIDIECNGNIQTVVLDATSKSVRELRGYIVKGLESMEEDEEIQIYDSLVIAKGARFEMLPGTKLYLHDKAKIVVYGTLWMHGSQEKPAVVRGDRMDNMFDNLPYDNLPSQWGSLSLTKESKDNQLYFADIHGMSEGIIVESDAHICNSKIKNSDGNLISAKGAEMEIVNCELKNSAGALLDLIGGKYDIIQCTLANYNFASAITHEAVHITNNDASENITIPLHGCDFVNTIIWGKKYDPEISIEYVEPAKGDSIFCYHFDHCLLRANGNDDEQFVETIWNSDPMFCNIDDANYIYDLHLTEGSPCVGTGSAYGTQKSPFDLDGNPRKDKPSIGCYEFSNNK